LLRVHSVPLSMSLTKIDHLEQPSWWSRATYCQLPKTLSRWLFSISKEGDTTNSLGNVCWRLVTLTVKKVLSDVQREPPMLQFVPISHRGLRITAKCVQAVIWNTYVVRMQNGIADPLTKRVLQSQNKKHLAHL